MRSKIFAVYIIIIISFTSFGFAYSHWKDHLYIFGKVKTTSWGACIKISKEIEGCYTDPYTGNDLSVPTPYIHVGSKKCPGFPNLFKLTIYVKNCGGTKLHNVVVKDKLEQQVTWKNYTAYEDDVEQPQEDVTWQDIPGSNNWMINYLTWDIGNLGAHDDARLEIWIETLPNPQGKYEPTSGDEGDSQEIPVNLGANVTATNTFDDLFAETRDITLWVEDDRIPGNGIAIVKVILSPGVYHDLPYQTPWAEDKYP